MTWPTVAVDTTDTDATTDSPAAARADLLDAIQKLNQMIAHPSTTGKSVMSAADAAALQTLIGALTVGKALIVAASQADGRSAIGAASTGANTFSAAQTISSTAAYIDLIETDAAAENGKWRLTASVEALVIRTLTDALGAGENILAVQRTGTAIDSITVPMLTVEGTLVSTKAAATGYSRVSPNMCRVNDATGNTSLTRDTLILVTGPAGAKGLILKVYIAASSNQAVGFRNTNVKIYSDSSGTTEIAEAICDAYEQVASATLLFLAEDVSELHVKCDSSARVWLKMTDDAGNNGVANYKIVGYYD